MSEEQNSVQNLAAAAEQRDRVIVRTSIIGIIANVFLAGFKAAVGLLANSIAVILDAVNNLSDALSSVVTIIGTKLANRRPDRKHPLGHGRIEYLSAMIVAALVLYAGITSLVESIKKIIHPEAADYSTVTLIVVASAVIVKLLLGRFVSARGKKVNSGALTASGKDALFDAILSASVLASAIIYLTTGLSLEAYVGVLISLFILKSGFELMKEALDDILGHREDAETTVRIKELINDEPEVMGAYDLVLYNYGPSRSYGSVHVELPDTMKVDEVDVLTRRIQAKVYNETGVILTGVGVYSHNTQSGEVAEIRNTVQEKVFSHDWALQLHGFYADTENKTMRFDVVTSFDVDAGEAVEGLRREINEIYPDYEISIIPDVDVTD